MEAWALPQAHQTDFIGKQGIFDSRVLPRLGDRHWVMFRRCYGLLEEHVSRPRPILLESYLAEGVSGAQFATKDP